MISIENLASQTLEQRTLQWHRLRWGLITGTGVYKIMKGGRTAQTYLEKVAYQRMNDFEYESGYTSIAMQWGIDNEQSAIDHYRFATCQDVKDCGFWVKTPRSFGVSPDGLIGTNGMLEVKCPYNPEIHLETALSGKVTSNKYFVQMQSGMYATGREWCDYVSFDPRAEESLQLVIIRVPSDKGCIKRISEAIKIGEEQIANII